jgi:hypothetical protein
VHRTTRTLRRLALAALTALFAATAPAAPARSFVSCGFAKQQYAAITAQVKKASAKVDEDGSGQVAVPTFVKDLKHLQKLKARQRAAAQALHSCKH